MTSDKQTSEEINQPGIKYENFLHDIMKDNLRHLEETLQRVNTELGDSMQDRKTLKVIKNKTLNPNGIKTQVNLGYNFFMEASVPDTSKLLVHIGVNHYAELTAEEADKHLELRIKHYNDTAKEILDKVVETKAHIKLLIVQVEIDPLNPT